MTQNIDLLTRFALTIAPAVLQSDTEQRMTPNQLADVTYGIALAMVQKHEIFVQVEAKALPAPAPSASELDLINIRHHLDALEQEIDILRGAGLNTSAARIYRSLVNLRVALKQKAPSNG